MDWFRKALSMRAGGLTETDPGGALSPDCAYADAFKSHWLQIRNILRCEHPTVDMQTAVFRHLEQLVTLLVAESAESAEFRIGPMLEFAFNECVFSLVVSWATDCTGRPKLYALRTIFKIYETIVSHTTPCIIVHKPILQPLLFALEECDSGDDEWVLNDIREPMVFLLHQICTKIAQKEEWSMLEFFFQKENDCNAPRFLVFTLLVPFLYYGGRVEQLVRDALLLVLSVSSQLDAAGEFLAEETNFCPVLASGLAAVYSSLPRKLHFGQVYEDWCRVTDTDLHHCPELLSFRNALEFCNAVAQASHQRVISALVKYFYNGFLLSVFKPALLESTAEDLHAVIAYLELILRCLSERPLRRSLVRFLLAPSSSGLSILQSLVQRMDRHRQLTSVCLAVFETVLNLNDEAVMFELIFRYVAPLRHLLADRANTLECLSLFDGAFDAFVATSPLCGLKLDSDGGFMLDESEEGEKAADDNYMEDEGGSVGASGCNDMVNSVFEYFKSARHRVESCRYGCRQWRYAYDGRWPNDSGAEQEAAQSKAEMLSSRLSDGPVGLNANCLFRQSRTKAYYAKKKLDRPQRDRSHAISALDLAISGADADIEGLNEMLCSVEDKSRLISFESEAFLNLYCSTAVPSSFMQLTFVESCPSGRDPPLYNDQGAYQPNNKAQSSGDGSAAVDFSNAVNVDTFEEMLRSYSGRLEGTDGAVHDTVCYINYMYDKLLLPRLAAPSVEAGAGSSKTGRDLIIHKLKLDSSVDSLYELDGVDLRNVIRDEDSPLFGPFLCALLAKLECMLNNSLYENLLLTGVIARLACYPHLLISSILLSSLPLFQPSVKPLFQILTSLSQDIQRRISSLEHLPLRLQLTKEMIAARKCQPAGKQRRQGSFPFDAGASASDRWLLNMGRNGSSYSRLGKEERAFLAGYGYSDVVNPVLQSAIVLDEFCKEMAAIALEQSLTIRLTG